MTHFDQPISNLPSPEADGIQQGASVLAGVPEQARPNRGWHGFIGQSDIVRCLKVHINGAKRRQSVVPSVLLLGTSGSGKSALAKAMACEIGTARHRVVASSEFTRKQLTCLLDKIAPGDVVFLDEAHSLAKEVQEALMKAIDDHAIAFTLVLATDQPGELLHALDRRMSQRMHLGPYADTALISMCSSFARTRKLRISAQGKRLLCDHARGEPRKIRHLVEGLQRTFERTDQVNKEDVRQFLDVEGFDRQHGNDSTERAYLTILAKNSPMSLDKIKALVGVDAKYIMSKIEPRMLDKGWVNITSGGREITSTGRLVAESQQAAQN